MIAAKVGQAVGGMASAVRGFALGPCGHPGCTKRATEGEAFRLRTPKGARYRTRLTWFFRCDKPEHSHWKAIGYRGVGR